MHDNGHATNVVDRQNRPSATRGPTAVRESSVKSKTLPYPPSAQKAKTVSPAVPHNKKTLPLRPVSLALRLETPAAYPK